MGPVVAIRRLVREDALDELAEILPEAPRILLVGGLEEKIHRVGVQQIGILGHGVDRKSHLATLRIQLGGKILQCIVGTFGHHAPAALAAGPVELVVEPDGGEAELLGSIQDILDKLKPLLGEVLHLAARARVDQELRDAHAAILRHEVPDELPRRAPRHRRHRD